MNHEEFFKLAHESAESIASGSASPLLAAQMIRRLIEAALANNISIDELVAVCFIAGQEPKTGKRQMAIITAIMENASKIQELEESTTVKKTIKRLSPYQRHQLRSVLEIIENPNHRD